MKQVIVFIAMILLGLFIAGLVGSFKTPLETKTTQTKTEITSLSMGAITMPERIG